MLLKKEILSLRAKLKESADIPLEKFEKPYMESMDPEYGSLEYVTGEDDDYLYEMTGGTSLRGTINAPYQKLVQYFGEPKLTKCTAKELPYVDTFAEWAIQFVEYDDDGDPSSVYAFIYDWRMGYDIDNITEWRVGGKEFGVDQKVRLVLEGKGKRKRS